MQRRVQDLGIARAIEALSENFALESGVDFFGAEDHFLVLHRLGELDGMDLLHVHHAVDDRLVVRRQHLAARRPIDLHRVVARRVVAGGDHDAARALLVAHQERQFRRTAIVVQEVDLETGRDHDARAQFGKAARVVTRVVRDRARQLALDVLFDVVGQALGAFADRAVVDGVRADRIHPPTATAGAERNHRPERIVERLPLLLGQMLSDFRRIHRIPRLRQPLADVLDRSR
jgi:hypothetical protein